MYEEDALLPLSGLQHFVYCKRQWALIHLEQTWDENRFTAEGQILHRNAHDAGTEKRAGIHITCGLRIRSLELGISGIADVVEFHEDQNGIKIPGRRGYWRPYPVEYKRGRPKKDHCDEIQVCAQAVCLEEMLHVTIPDGALYYGKTHRRHAVTFDDSLRARLIAVAREMHHLWEIQQTPAAEPGPKCDECSLASRCIPATTNRPNRTIAYVNSIFMEEP